MFLTDSGYARLPLKRLQTGHYKLSLRINEIKGDLILDTGASASCIGTAYVEHFGLRSEESDLKAAGAGSSDLETRMSRNNSISIGSVEKTRVTLVLFDMSNINSALDQVDEPPVHGILGADLLKRLRAVIDYGRNALYIRP